MNHLRKIHARTIQILGPKAESIIAHFHHEASESGDPAYFAPFLKTQRRSLGLPEALIELATLEWTIYSVESQVGIWKHGIRRGILKLNPSLNLIPFEYDVWAILKDNQSFDMSLNSKKPHVLAIYLQSQHRLATVCRVLPEWALILDSLAHGAQDQESLVVSISKRKNVLFPKGRVDEILQHLIDIKIIESENS